MKYTLITPRGRVLTFYLQALAETYQQAYGGQLITEPLYSQIYSELLVDEAEV